MKIDNINCSACGKDTPHRIRKRYKKPHGAHGSASVKLTVIKCLGIHRTVHVKPESFKAKMKKSAAGFIK